MPYKITKNDNGTYKVVSKDDAKHVYAYATKDPKKLIQAIETGFRKSRAQNEAKYSTSGKQTVKAKKATKRKGNSKR